MHILLLTDSGVDSFFKLLGLSVVFVLILVATYYTTKWVAKSGAVRSANKNIKIVETHRITQNKYIQIIQIGQKYVAVGIGKEEIEFLTCLDESELDLSEKTGSLPAEDFKEVFGKLLKRQQNDKK